MIKKEETIKVDKKFLMTMAKQIDKLKKEVEIISAQPQKEEPHFDYTVTFSITDMTRSTDIQNRFIRELSLIINNK